MPRARSMDPCLTPEVLTAVCNTLLTRSPYGVVDMGGSLLERAPNGNGGSPTPRLSIGRGRRTSPRRLSSPRRNDSRSAAPYPGDGNGGRGRLSGGRGAPLRWRQ